MDYCINCHELKLVAIDKDGQDFNEPPLMTVSFQLLEPKVLYLWTTVLRRIVGPKLSE
ncbi:MAG TPA: hypothetical protein VF141_13435 [Chryseolinea sp.]